MALSRVTVWSSGQVLTASALNGEFDNILSNAMSLISPLTANLAAGGFDITGLDELAFDNGGAAATAAGRLRRNATVLSWHNATAAADVLTAHLIDAKGDLLVGTADNTAARFAVGGNGAVVIAASGDTPGVRWGALRGHLFGLTLSNNAGDATNDIDVAAGEAASDDNPAYMLTLAASITKRLDASWSVGTNQGGLDSGSIADDVYHVFLIKRSDTGVVDVLFSASASAPTMPANYDQKRRIGAIIRSTSILAFTQRGDEFWLTTPVQDISVTEDATANTRTLASVPDGIAVKAFLGVNGSDASSTTAAVYVSALTSTDSAVTNALNTVGIATGGATSNLVAGFAQVWTNTSAQIRTRADAASTGLSIQVYGWMDPRGRDS